MIKNYELMVIISPKLSADAADKANQELLTWVEENGGEIDSTDSWGKRALAYPIDKVTEGYYFVNYFKLEATSVKVLGRLMNINENIIRHMFVAKDA
ncbi:MAG TPA: 30S ribosomal protein S6 [Candidatus Cloacimonadota bacterium]|nr:30S ribosomal protein S6 [Candidatus Cloacimonadota bacterium]